MSRCSPLSALRCHRRSCRVSCCRHSSRCVATTPLLLSYRRLLPEVHSFRVIGRFISPLTLSPTLPHCVISHVTLRVIANVVVRLCCHPSCVVARVVTPSCCWSPCRPYRCVISLSNLPALLHRVVCSLVLFFLLYYQFAYFIQQKVNLAIVILLSSCSYVVVVVLRAISCTLFFSDVLPVALQLPSVAEHSSVHHWPISDLQYVDQHGTSACLSVLYVICYQCSYRSPSKLQRRNA